MTQDDVLERYKEKYYLNIVDGIATLYPNELRDFIQSEITKAKEEEREKVEGEIYNELVKISDKSYGVLKMLDVAQYILLDRRGVK